jgi:predicted acetyltransferase
MVILRNPRVEDESCLRNAHQELASEGHEGFLLHGYVGDATNFDDYIARVEQYSIGNSLPIGMVQDTFLVAEQEGEIVGRISIRHELNDFLLNFGGHIGYMVRPKYRLRGIASEMLSQALERCRELGLNRVLLTCDDDNIGSIKTIEKHLGRLENKVLHHGSLLRRYWIELD